MTCVVTIFDVERAGCSSCAERVRGALSAIATVESVVVDEAADVATVRLVSATELETHDVDALLEAAGDSAHAYRVKPGSWRVLA